MIDRTKFEQVPVIMTHNYKRSVLWIVFGTNVANHENDTRMGIAMRRKLPNLLFKLYISDDGKTILIEPQKHEGPGVLRITNKSNGSFSREPANSMLKKRDISPPAYYEGKWSESDNAYVFKLVSSGENTEDGTGGRGVAKPRRKSLADMLPTK